MDLSNKITNEILKFTGYLPENKSDFKIGDKVYCLIFGEGEIVDIADDEEYPLVINFNKFEEYKSFTYTGKFLNYTSINKTLFHFEDKPFEDNDREDLNDIKRSFSNKNRALIRTYLQSIKQNKNCLDTYDF